MGDARWYMVMIETGGPPVDEGRLEDFLEELQRDGIEGVVVSAGTKETSGPGATFSLRASNPLEALASAFNVFGDAARSAGIPLGHVERVEVMTEEFRDRSLDQEPEQYVGVAEVAGLLGVSKQRVSQMEEVDGFPAPVARLASGPVWRLATLQRFVSEWPRKPGRPPKQQATAKKAIGGKLRRRRRRVKV